MKSLIKTTAIIFACCLSFAATTQPSLDYTILIEDLEVQPGVTIDINVNVFVNENATNWSDDGKIIAIEGMAHTGQCMKPLAEEMFLSNDPQMEINELFAIDSPGKGLSGLPEGGDFLFEDLYFEDYLNIFFGVISYLNDDLDIYPRAILGHSLGGLMVLKLQDTLVKQGTNLKAQFGINKCILLAPAVPDPLPWSFIGSPLAQGLLGYAQFFVPGYGSILNMPPTAWVYSLFTNTCCYFAPNAVPGAPTPAEAELNGYVGIEPAPMLLQISGMAIPPGLPYPYKPRISAKAGIFMPQNGVQLTIIADEFDRMMHPDEEEALYVYLTGDATLAHMHTVLGEETCHDTHISDPHAVVELFSVPFHQMEEAGGFTIFNDLFYSDALEALESVDVWLPPGYDENSDQHYPVIYLLHKAFSNENEYEWFLPALNQMLASGEIDPFVIVKPNGWAPPYLGSCWFNSPLYGNYEDMLLDDLIPYIEDNFRVLPGQDYRFHLGQAMGGHAGWSMSIRYPELFSVVADISGYKHLGLLNQLSAGLVLAESGGAPPYEYSPSNGQLSALWFTMLGAYAPNMANPPFYVNVTIDENGNFIPEYVEQYLQDDIASMISGHTQPVETKYWFANGLTDMVAPYPIALAFKDTLDKYGWEYEFYTYDGGYSGVEDPLAEAFRFIDGVWKEKQETQTLEVEQGWSLISSYLMPANPVVDDIFAVPVADNELIFGLNSDGMYWPGQNVNTMGFWWTKQAMKVKAANPFSFDVSGLVWEDKSVMLAQGLNYLPVLSEVPVAADDIFDQLGDTFLYAFDIANNLVYWPAGQIFTLENLLPGDGYLAITTAPGMVVFPENLKNSPTQPGTEQFSNQPLVSANTGIQHFVVIPSSLLEDFEQGCIFSISDESGKVWATSKLEDKLQPMVLSVAGDDPTTEIADGMTGGEAFILKIKDSKGLETILSANYDTNIGHDGYFEPYAISQVSELKATSIDEMNSQTSFQITPNPARNKATVSWFNAEDQAVNISLLNLHGQYLETIVTEDFKAGQQSFIWHTSHLPEGMYFLNIKAGSEIFTQKIMIIK